MEDVKHLMRDHYLKYASYVILDRAIPNVIDGLKPVQRRILHTLWRMHDGKLHKVANVAGQTMAFHPHGDAPITEALVHMANKNYLFDTQGNFGNPLTGDPAAAARYIETRLSPLSLETMFNPDLTDMVPSYDGRHKEPVCLPAKVPLLLLQGAEGIAVGMATSILPHNFVELLEAQIAILEGKSYEILPDFPTGGIMDASNYQRGKGKVKLRVKFDITDAKTVVIREICYGTTTESLIRSIDDAAKKGKIKIDAINDYTASHVEIELKLPRGHYAEELIDSLYAYTECEISLSPQMVTIKDNFPWEGDVHEILELQTAHLKQYLKSELEIARDRAMEKIFDKTLEEIFIENRLYKHLEEVSASDQIDKVIADALLPFHPLLTRAPTADDRERLLAIPIRRISRFDLDKNHHEIATLREEVTKIEYNLAHLTKYTITYIKGLLKKYAKAYPRRTQLNAIADVDIRAIATRNIKVGIDLVKGFVGTKVTEGTELECTNFDKLLILYADGSYKVITIPEKQYVASAAHKVLHVAVADKKTPFYVLYKDPKTHLMYAKSFIIDKYILDKEYSCLPEDMQLAHFSCGTPPLLELQFIPAPKQKVNKVILDFKEIAIKGVTAKGTRAATKGIKKVCLLTPKASAP